MALLIPTCSNERRVTPGNALRTCDTPLEPCLPRQEYQTHYPVIPCPSSSSALSSLQPAACGLQPAACRLRPPACRLRPSPAPALVQPLGDGTDELPIRCDRGRSRSCRDRGRAGRCPDGCSGGTAHDQSRHGGSDELQSGDWRGGQGADRTRDRRAGRCHGTGDRCDRDSVPDAQLPQGAGHAQSPSAG